MNVTYTGKLDIGGGGIGTTAYHQVMPLEREGLLKVAYAANNSKAPKKKLFRKVPSSPDKELTDNQYFDIYCSMKIKDAKVIQSWCSHCLNTFEKHPNSVKVINLFSAHIKTQAKLVNGELGTQLVSDSNIKQVSRELELADYIFIPSEFIRSSLREYKLDGKVIMVPFGVDLVKFYPVERKDKTFRVIFSGQNWIRKGLIYLLNAWNEINLENSELIVTGIAPELAVELNKKFPSVKAGWVENIIEAYQQSDVFCLPALEDGCPLATYEAMACGLPAIITNTTGTYQHIYNGTNGFIINSRDSKAIAERLQWLHDNREQCRKMGMSARKTIEAFPWERHEKGYIDFIKRII